VFCLYGFTAPFSYINTQFDNEGGYVHILQFQTLKTVGGNYGALLKDLTPFGRPSDKQGYRGDNVKAGKYAIKRDEHNDIGKFLEKWHIPVKVAFNQRRILGRFGRKNIA